MDHDAARARRSVSLPFVNFIARAARLSFVRAEGGAPKSRTMKDALEDFRQTLQSAERRLLALTEEESDARRAPGKWSPKETLGHLIDSASNNHQRFVRAQFTDDLVFPGYEQDEWVVVQQYGQEPWPFLVRLWLSYNLHLLHLVSHIPEAKLKQQRREHNLDRIAWQTVSTSEPVTLDYFIRDYIQHLKHHLQQIFEPNP
jgi:hypothetical protein